MLGRLLRALGGAVWLSLLALILPFSFSSVRAETNTVTGPTDYWVEVTEPSVLTARTYAQQFGIDSHLWLYTATGTLIAANDDWFGLDSWLEHPVEPGSYRLRAGVCCGNPDAWYGSSYSLELNFTPTEPTTTSTSTTSSTIVPETTTTTEPEPETTTSTSTSTEPPPSTTEPEPGPTAPTTTTEAPQPPIVLPPSPEPEPEPEPAPTPAPETTVGTPETDAPTTIGSTVAPETSQPETTVEALPEPTEPESPAPDPTEPPTSKPVEEPEPEPTREVTEILSDLTTISASDLATISEADLGLLLDSIGNNDLSDEAAEAIAQAMSQAPDQIKAEFEQEINIFGGQFDSYVPLGSVISVGERRTVVAVSVGVAVPAAATARRRP